MYVYIYTYIYIYICNPQAPPRAHARGRAPSVLEYTGKDLETGYNIICYNII